MVACGMWFCDWDVLEIGCSKVGMFLVAVLLSGGGEMFWHVDMPKNLRWRKICGGVIWHVPCLAGAVFWHVDMPKLLPSNARTRRDNK
jgi:hypothetical protein